jgi:hypothetical protein
MGYDFGSLEYSPILSSVKFYIQAFYIYMNKMLALLLLLLLLLLSSSSSSSFNSGDPHRSDFKFDTAALSALCAMFQL